MKFGLIRFPESTGHDDLNYVLSDIFEQEVCQLWCREHTMPRVDALIIPAGIADSSFHMRSSEPVIEGIKKYAQNGGFVLGIGYGFQLLCSIGLLPGRLEQNSTQQFCSKNVYIKPKHNLSALTAKLNTNFAYKIPIAQYTGRFASDDETIKGMRENHQILFQYCTEDGHLSEQANPTGSRANIAAICNSEKNVYGIIPQPERAADDEIGNTDGGRIFESIFAYLK